MKVQRGHPSRLLVVQTKADVTAVMGFTLSPRADLHRRSRLNLQRIKLLNITSVFSKYSKSVYSFIFNLGRYLKNWDLKVSVCACTRVRIHVCVQTILSSLHQVRNSHAFSYGNEIPFQKSKFPFYYYHLLLKNQHDFVIFIKHNKYRGE